MDRVVQNYHAASTVNPWIQIAVWQIVCFFGVIGLIWLNEIVDFQNMLFGAPSSPGEWSSAGLLTIGVMFLCTFAILPIYVQAKAIARRAVTICSYCGKVRINEQPWEKIGSFFSKRFQARLSHGVCQDCGERVMHDYRCGKKNAGSRETIQSESFV